MKWLLEKIKRLCFEILPMLELSFANKKLKKKLSPNKCSTESSNKLPRLPLDELKPKYLEEKCRNVPHTDKGKSNTIELKIAVSIIYPPTAKGDVNTTSIFQGLSLSTLKLLYDEEKIRKNTLEDKAKSNTMGLTIAISIMMNGAQVFVKTPRNWNIPWLYWVNIAMLILIVLYFIIAGIYSIKCFSSENIFHFVSPHSLEDDGDEESKINDYITCLHYNQIRNSIRNNLLSVSYSCIRNAIILLFFSFVVTIMSL